jgi:hypothetical protein
VVKFNPVGRRPRDLPLPLCRLQQAGTSRLMDGDIRYIPGTTELRVTFVLRSPASNSGCRAPAGATWTSPTTAWL